MLKLIKLKSLRTTNTLKVVLRTAFILSTLIFVTSCSDEDDDTEYGNWVESSSFDGSARANSVSFVIGDKGYLVSGYDGDDYLNDLWEYNKEGDYWVQKASFPGVARSGAVGFSINGIGYFGTGYDGDNKLKDFWSYDPATDTWEQQVDFLGSARYGAVGFAVNDKGYIGTGFDGSELKDFYQYNPTTNEWIQSVGFGGDKRKDAAVFVIGNSVYLGSGLHNGAYETDFYEFDGTTETWTRLTDLDDDDSDYAVLLSGGVGFSQNGLGYFATGTYSGVSTNLWIYDPSADTWDQGSYYEGSARQDAVVFDFSSDDYVLMGRSGSYYFDDNWEFRPDEESNDED